MILLGCVQSVPAENNGGADTTDIALCMELITFGGFGTPPGRVFFGGSRFFGVMSTTANDIGPGRIAPAWDDFQPSREPNARIALPQFLRTADLSGVTAPQGYCVTLRICHDRGQGVCPLVGQKIQAGSGAGRELLE